MSITDRMNLVYQDADIIPLFIQVCGVAISRTGAHFLRHRRSTGELSEHAPKYSAKRPPSHGTHTVFSLLVITRILTVLVTGAAGGRGC
jgi:hypothetical protein